MDLKERIDRINAARKEHGLSIQQFADMCGISASTVSRTLVGKTEPTDFTISAMEGSLGITDNPMGDPIMERVASDPILERYLNMQEMRIVRLRAHYNMLLAEKNRWIMLLFILCIVFVIFISSILVLDVLHPDIGWIQEKLGLGFDRFKDILQVSGDLLQNFCLYAVF